MKTVLIVALSIFNLVIWTVMVVMGIHFKQGCGGHLKRAADANTIEIAESELKMAIDYMEANNLTTGYTSVLWKTPDEDIQFWYNNIKTSYQELIALKDDSPSMEKSNMLMKLRETILDHGDKGDNLTTPNGISRYPNNALIGTLFWIGLIGWAVTASWIANEL